MAKHIGLWKTVTLGMPMYALILVWVLGCRGASVPKTAVAAAPECGFWIHSGDFCLVSAPAPRVPFRPFETPNSLAFRCTLTVVSLSLQKGKPPLDDGTWFQGVGSLPDREHVSCWCLETHIQALATPTGLPAVCWALAKQCFFRSFLGVRGVV